MLEGRFTVSCEASSQIHGVDVKEMREKAEVRGCKAEDFS